MSDEHERPAAGDEPADRQGPVERETGGVAPGQRPDPLASRGLRWGAATAVYVAVVLAVLVGVNLVGSRLKNTWDLTAGHQLTLSTASKNILAQLKQPVQIIAFEQPGDLTATQVEALLRQYVTASHGKITFQVVDPAADRALAVRYNVTQYGTVVVASGNNTEQVMESDMTTYSASGQSQFSGEGPITNAIIRAAAPVHLTVDFVTGDGEPDPVNAGDLPDALAALQSQGYTVNSLNLLQTPSISPKNVAALILITPQHDLSTSEIGVLKAYANAGGHLVVLLDPVTKPLTNLDGLLSSWGVTPQNSLVIERTAHYGTDPTQILPTLTQSQITAPLQTAHLGVLFLAAQGLDVAQSTPGYIVNPVLTSSPPPASGGPPNSWAIRDLATISQRTSLDYNAKTDIAGPVNLAVTVLPSSAASSAGGTTTDQSAPLGQTQFRAVIFGNSAFIASSSTGQANGPINVQGNRDLFLNAVGWATGLAQGIAVRPNASLDTQVVLNGGSTRALMDTFVAGVPLVCFALAFSTWWSRRRL